MLNRKGGGCVVAATSREFDDVDANGLFAGDPPFPESAERIALRIGTAGIDYSACWTQGEIGGVTVYACWCEDNDCVKLLLSLVLCLPFAVAVQSKNSFSRSAQKKVEQQGGKKKPVKKEQSMMRPAGHWIGRGKEERERAGNCEGKAEGAGSKKIKDKQQSGTAY